MNVRALLSDWCYVRRNALKSLPGVTRNENGMALFQLKPETRRFGDSYCRLPRWARWLALKTAQRPQNEEVPR